MILVYFRNYTNNVSIIPLCYQIDTELNMNIQNRQEIQLIRYRFRKAHQLLWLFPEVLYLFYKHYTVNNPLVLNKLLFFFSELGTALDILSNLFGVHFETVHQTACFYIQINYTDTTSLSNLKNATFHLTSLLDVR